MIRGIIFPTQDVAGAQGWNQHLLDIGAKDFRVERAVEDPRRVDAIMAQGGEECHGIPVPERGFGLDPVAAFAPTPQGSHVGLGRCFVYKYQAFGVNPALILLPAHPPARHIRPVLLAGQHAFF